MLRRLTLLTTLTLTMTFLIAGCGSNQADDDAQKTAIETAPGNPAVENEFLFTTYDVDGNIQSTDQWIGKQALVLNFWGTWCPPCRKEIPDLVKVYNEFRGQDIEMLGLAVRDMPDNVIKFSRDNAMDWPMLMADNSLAIKFRITGVPTTIFISRNGTELGRFVGPQDYETFKRAFELALQH